MSVDTEGKKTEGWVQQSGGEEKSNREHQEGVAMLGKALRKSDHLWRQTVLQEGGHNQLSQEVLVSSGK